MAINFFEKPAKPDNGFKKLSWTEIKPGTQMEHVGDKRARELGMEKEGWEHEDWEAEPKTYRIDSGVIAYVDEEGKLFVAHATDEHREAIKKSGYQENTKLHIPLTHGERFADTDAAEDWNKSLEK